MKKNEIDLNLISESRKDFHFDYKELAEIVELRDYVVFDEKNEVSIKIRPIDGHHYQVKAYLHFTTPTLCTRCGEEFSFDFEKNVEEFLSTKSKEGEDKGFLLVENPHKWNWALFVTETVELETPYQNYKYGEKCLVSCEHYDEALKKGLFGDSNVDIKKKENPFSKLKKLKN